MSRGKRISLLITNPFTFLRKSCTSRKIDIANVIFVISINFNFIPKPIYRVHIYDKKDICNVILLDLLFRTRLTNFTKNRYKNITYSKVIFLYVFLVKFYQIFYLF